jgi:hypothetical protein
MDGDAEEGALAACTHPSFRFIDRIPRLLGVFFPSGWLAI